MTDANDRKTRLAELSGRLVSVTKSADLLAAVRELEAIGVELADEERSERPTSPATWPRDMNESAESATAWGKDSTEDVRE